MPTAFFLEQNYPNPFNPSTVISYHVAKDSKVRLKIYDAIGREVTTLVNESQNAGNYKVNWNASGLASGTYFYSLQIGNDVISKKAVLLK